MSLIDVNKRTAETTSKLSSGGKWLIGLTGGIGLGLSIICVPFVSPALRKYCLPYVPATTKQVNNVIAALTKGVRPFKSNKVLDIGSGDGRIVIAAAKCGFQSHGVELNPWLVYFSRLAAIKNGVSFNTKFFRKDLWKFNISEYDKIVIFGVEEMMKEIEAKFTTELKPKTTIIVCRFPLPTLEPNRTIDDGVDSIWIYEIK